MPDNIIFNNDFSRYKGVSPVLSVINKGGKKDKVFDFISTSDVTEKEIDNYSLGRQLHLSKGNFYPYFRRFDNSMVGQHGYMFCCLLIGEHGSGKTTLCSKLAKIWRKQNKRSGGSIVLISTQNDECMNKLNPIRINCTHPDKVAENFLNEETIVRFVNPETDESEFKNCLLIVDDLEGIQANSDKEKKKILGSIYNNIIHPCLYTGRHHNCSIILIRHNLNLSKPEERAILNEADFLGLFPFKSAPQRIRYLLERYCCLPKNYVDSVMRLNSRYILHHNRYPSVTIAEHDVLQNT